MKIGFKSNNKPSVNADYRVWVGAGLKNLSKLKINNETTKTLELLAKRNGFEGKQSQVVSVDVLNKGKLETYILVGCEDFANLENIRRACAMAARSMKNIQLKSIKVDLAFSEKVTTEVITAAVEGFLLPTYTFLKYKSDNKSVNTKADMNILSELPSAKSAAAVKKGEWLSYSVYFARDLINESPSVLYPESLGKIVKSTIKGGSVKVQVFNEAWLKSKKMNGILNVGRGSEKKPVLIEVAYKPKGKIKKHIVLVGKGVTFDAGGLSIKISGSMVNMKMDMGGAGAVIGTMNYVAKSQPNVAVTALIPSVENMPDGKSYRVDDVLTMANGTTVEVNNTDAEGRLILADALYWATLKKPDCIIDVATLTGACVVALGNHTAGLMSNDENLVTQLVNSSQKTGEKIARLPLDPELADGLNSYIADQKNTGGREGGTITAGLFLQKFVGNCKWAHLDIAGKMKAVADANLYDAGATGFGVRLLADFIENE